MISAAELAAIQATSASSGDLSIAVMRRGITQDAEGNVLPTYTLHATVAGNLAQPTAGQLANYGYAIADLAAWMVRVPVGTDVQIGDRLSISGQTMEVQIILNPESYGASTRVLAAEVKRV